MNEPTFTKEDLQTLLDALTVFIRSGEFKQEESQHVNSLWHKLRWACAHPERVELETKEYVYEWRKDHDNDADPGHFAPHPILKRTKMFVFVEYKLGRDREVLKLRRQELEEKGHYTWFGDHGYVHRLFYTEELKKRADERRNKEMQ